MVFDVEEFARSIEPLRDCFLDLRYSEKPLRRFSEVEDPIEINRFKSDCGKIANSKAYRRLARKSQVFPDTINPHIRTRLSHTMEVVSIAEVISDFMGLNTELCRAGALAHDIGHWPFGHLGEDVATDLSERQYGKERKFKHAEYGVIVAQRIERPDEIGLNATYPTLLCVQQHSKRDQEIRADPNSMPEPAVVMNSDKIGYTFADFNDAISRMGIIDPDTLPNYDYLDVKNMNQRALTTTCICALIKESSEKGYISFETNEIAKEFSRFKRWMYDNVYFKVDHKLQETYLTTIYEFFCEDDRFEDVDPLILLSLMTDDQAVKLASEIGSRRFIHDGMLDQYGISEIIPYVRGKEIDFTKPDLRKKDFIY
jgi:dGTPase